MAPSHTPTPSDRSSSTRQSSDFHAHGEIHSYSIAVSLMGKVLDLDTQSCQHPPGMTYLGRLSLQGAHIITFSASAHSEALSIFADQSVETMLTGSQINDPSNGLMLDPATHSLFGRFRVRIQRRDKI
ncbi:hypothetical protein V1509DRAFT_626654 [Lipomyces kononenkoae]